MAAQQKENKVKIVSVQSRFQWRSRQLRDQSQAAVNSVSDWRGQWASRSWEIQILAMRLGQQKKKAQQLGSPWEKMGNPLQRKAFPTQILASHEQLRFAYPRSLPGQPAADFTLRMSGEFPNSFQTCFFLWWWLRSQHIACVACRGVPSGILICYPMVPWLHRTTQGAPMASKTPPESFHGAVLLFTTRFSKGKKVSFSSCATTAVHFV